jgi:Protein of unknown function (DUF2975)
MKKHFLIIYILNGVSQLWLLSSILYCILLAFFLITGKDVSFSKAKTSGWRVSNIYKDGYPIPAKLTVQMPPDTMVQWEHGDTNGEMDLSKNRSFRFDKADSILSDTAIKKKYYFSKWTIVPGYDDNYQFKNSYWAADEFALFDSAVKYKTQSIIPAVEERYFADVQIKLKTKSTAKNFALALYSLFSAIVMLLISFNVVKLFNYIRREGSFLSPLYRVVFNIGLILSIGQIVNLILGFLYARWYGAVTLEKVSSIDKLGGTEFNVQFNPTIDFNFAAFLFGLSLIVIASLFKYGNKLEKENALTI